MATKKKVAKKAVRKREPRMDRVIRDTLKSLIPKDARIKTVKTGEKLGVVKKKYDVVYAENYLEETERSNGSMWDLIRHAKYGGFVAVVVKIGADKASNFQGSGYFGSRFLPKFGFNIKLLLQSGDTIYFIGQV